ncbi:hypothetical protein QQS21_005403 [Conoideocrella luteorostrata]|uniref:Uncharacterized protein n=1 Tax=Conoideocrella luteorostrata TaxID=1105319 RepID=A0AAJ0CPJ1_9HYPO|nr:hypothetical protein QQS21_005403 [Conoideocrella luteorostrata]
MAPLPPHKARKHHTFLLSLFSSLVISFALFTYFMLMPFSQFTTHASRNKSLIRGDLHALKTSSRTVDFAGHDAYRNLSHEHDALWHDQLLPPNGGYFALAEKEKNSDKLGIAMFHQLRCLAMIRTEMQYLRDVIAALKSSEEGVSDQHHRLLDSRHASSSGGAGNLLDHDPKDPTHCFDYLRQSLLCLTDGTIERPKQYDDGRPYIDGMGERQCRDWDILYRASMRSDDQPVMPDDL